MQAPDPMPHDQSAEFAFLSDVLRALETLRPAVSLDLFWHASARLVGAAVPALHDAWGRRSPEDGKEFDHLSGDVDGMAMLWSEVRAEDVPRGHLRPMTLTIAKNRNGRVTDEPLCFDGELVRFVDAPVA